MRGTLFHSYKKRFLGRLSMSIETRFFAFFGAAGAENQVFGVDFGTFSLRKSPPKKGVFQQFSRILMSLVGVAGGPLRILKLLVGLAGDL